MGPMRQLMLVRKAFLQKSDFELLAFVKQGPYHAGIRRISNAARSCLRWVRPNNVGLTDDAELLKIVQFMRQNE